jgi:glycosyltransferase involved in cell wall biosynthesis
VSRLLLVTPYAPPSTLVAARRTAGLAKYLGRRGHDVTVLTSALSGDGALDGDATTVRTHDLIASRLNWRRRHFAALTGRSESTYDSPSRIQSVVVPDLAAVTWLPFALPRALALARKRRFDCVITSSPPESAHAVGYALRRRGVPWIVDLRDGWTFESPHAPWPLRVQRRVDGGLERWLLTRASAVVGVTAPIVEDVRDRFDVDARLITNGYDPEEHGAPADADGLLDPRRHSLVHTGRMGSNGSPLRPLLAALRLLRAETPEVAGALEVVFAGPLSGEEAEDLASPDLDGLVRAVGPLERKRVLALQRAAGGLLVITAGAARTSVATGKLFEYLGARRPILVLGRETEAARIVNEVGAGSATSASDPRTIAAALERMTAQRDAPRLRGVEKYSYPEVAKRYSELIREVVDGRPARTGESARATSRGR